MEEIYRIGKVGNSGIPWRLATKAAAEGYLMSPSLMQENRIIGVPAGTPYAEVAAVFADFEAPLPAGWVEGFNAIRPDHHGKLHRCDAGLS